MTEMCVCVLAGAGMYGRPLKSLVSFDRVSLGVGETKETALKVSAEHFTVTTGNGYERVALKGEWRLWVGVDGESDAHTVTVV